MKVIKIFTCDICKFEKVLNFKKELPDMWILMSVTQKLPRKKTKTTKIVMCQPCSERTYSFIKGIKK